MTRYQLAKLVQWAGKLRTRKRLQKVVYLLQAAGCPLDDEFGLHLFGPYSQTVAERTDEMTNLGLLQEECTGNVAGQQFNYALTDDAKTRLAALESTPHGQAWARELAPFEGQAKEFLATELRELEVAATIAFFRRQGHEWPEAVTFACSFKGLTTKDELVQRAEALARTVVA
jgi:uncharacterized protein YwgA